MQTFFKQDVKYSKKSDKFDCIQIKNFYVYITFMYKSYV